MKENRIEIVLRNGRSVGGMVRSPGFILLEGIAPECVTSFDIEKAVANKDVQARPAKVKTPASAEPAVTKTEPEPAKPKAKKKKKKK